MKFVAISDTHGQHRSLELPKGDCLLHGGDVSKMGIGLEISNFLDWFAEQDFEYKIFIAGNHDFYFENANESEIKAIIPDNVIYLNDSGITLEGIHIWGSPVQPWFFDWAFNRQRGPEIDEHWQLIPDDTDILITHGPPHGILDLTARNDKAGCADLLKKTEMVQPKFHIFGHIHEAYGVEKVKETTFINASVLNLKYELVNAPVVFEWGKRS